MAEANKNFNLERNIDKFLESIVKNKNDIETNEVSIRNLEKLEKLIKKYTEYFKDKNPNDKRLLSIFKGFYEEIRSCFLNFSKKIYQKAERNAASRDQFLELIKLHQKLLDVYKKYFDNNRKIDTNSEKLEVLFSTRFLPPKSMSNPRQLRLPSVPNNNNNLSSHVEIFSNKNAAEYHALLSQIKNYKEFKSIASEVFTLYKSVLDYALSTLQKINLQGLSHNQINNKIRIDIELLNKSIEKLYILCKEIIEIKKQKFNKNNNEDLLLMNNTLQFHKLYINTKNKILHGKNL